MKEAFYTNVIFDLEESEKMHEILAQSKIDKSTAENLYGAMKIVYHNGTAEKMFWIEEGDYIDEQKVRYEKKPILYRDYPVNNYKSLIEDENGKHKLGGTPPEDFVMPKNNTTVPYIYLGMLDCLSEKSLGWTLTNEIHLVCPIHSDFDILYLDYSNPKKPTVLNFDELEGCSSAYDDLKPSDKIVYKKVNSSFDHLSIEQVYDELSLGNLGAPSWIQDERIPKCPKSGKFMKFLIMLESNSIVEVESSDVDIKDEGMREYIESYNFWCDGALFVFFEPETKTVAYYIQNT